MIYFKHSVFFIIITIAFVLCHNSCSFKDKVTVYEEDITIPTYVVNEPEINPIFYTPQNYQGAQKRVYPNPLLNKLTDEKVLRTYKGLFLENEYVKICVLPEIGGRVYYAKDKTNDYDFVYHNRVIKPALIGMAGAWISGGIEWNIPHHHRVSTFMPVDYELTENSDGSKTIWVGEYEKRHGTRWVVGLTLFPDKSYIETDLKLFNVTPFTHSFLMWANVAVHANENYQVIFPPDVERAVYHEKVEFTNWPISKQYYRGIDFTEGVDVSWWKNTKSPTSFFAWGTKKDFLGGIDHGEKAGIILIGDRHTLPGKKFWNWGDNKAARMWDKKLTDEDGPYLELMMGAYSDNQPDYSWIAPGVAKQAKMYFYPVKDIHNFKNANKDFVLNLNVGIDSALIELNATSRFSDLKVILFSDQNIIYEDKIDINPSDAFSKTIVVPDSGINKNFTFKVISENGKELISYTPVPRRNEPEPAVYKEPKEPAEIAGLEELFLTGLRQEQFYNYKFDPEKYYKEALKQEPDNALVNTQLGLNYLKKGIYHKAEEKLRIAVNRLTTNYISPKFCEPLYYLGVSLYLQGKFEDAYKILNKSLWSYEWTTPANFLLTNIDSRNQRFEQALERINTTIEYNSNFIDALALQSMILRKLEKYDEAYETAKKILKIDPLNFIALNEIYLISSELRTGEKPKVYLNELMEKMRDEPDNYLETAARYNNAGFNNDAIKILSIAVNSKSEKLRSYPMIYYYLGYFYHLIQNEKNAAVNFIIAGKLPVDFCFPYGQISSQILEYITEKTSDDGNACYYLGNLYYDSQPDKALRMWRRALESGNTNPVVYRNLAFLYANVYDSVFKAIENIEKAIELKPDDPLYYYEADLYYAYAKVAPEDRLKFMEQNMEIIEKSNAGLPRLISLWIFMGKYNKAINFLENHRFYSAEAAEINLHVYWSDAHILRGMEYLRRKNYDKAIKDFRAVMEFPENLESVNDPKAFLAYYFLGLTYKLKGDFVEAKELFRKMTDPKEKKLWGAGNSSEILFYEALAHIELGEQSSATDIFNKLIIRGNAMLNTKKHSARYMNSVKLRQAQLKSRANAYFSVGLGHKGLGDGLKANTQLKKALDIDPTHLGAHNFLIK